MTDDNESTSPPLTRRERQEQLRRGLGGESQTQPAPAPTEPGGPISPRRERSAAPVTDAKSHRRRHRRRNVAALAVVLGLLLPFLVAAGWFVYQLDPPGGPGAEVTVQIERGWGRDEIGDALEEAGVIGNAWVFGLYAGVRNSGPFDAGEYALRKDMGVRDAISALEQGPTSAENVDVELVLPPGLTVEQIANRVGELPGLDAQAFLDAASAGSVRSQFQPADVTSLEGLLFPDTYRVGANETEVEVLEKLVRRFDEVANRMGLAQQAEAAGITAYEAVIIGSLVQTESGTEDDRAPISAVIHNRLDQGMPLQIDATLLYGRPDGADRTITDADKESDSPYNTYRVQGLPPTPISSVAEASLQAAVTPADVPYLFYVLIDDQGNSAFATTLEEHEANVAIARERGLL